MSAKSLMVNEGLLQEIEQRVQMIRSVSQRLVKQRDDVKFSFAAGVELCGEHDEHVTILREVAGQLFSALDLQDPEDGELQRREEEDEEDEEEEDEEDEEDAEDDE